MLYKLKSALRRSAFFAAAVAMLGSGVGAVLPHMASADALNPLTERSLTLSSSSPGFHYKDGAGNTTYAEPNSGPNGKQTGETFSFKVSTNSQTGGGGTGVPIKAFTFQYCTTAAGLCTAPGNDAAATGGGTPTPRGSDDATHSDLNAQYTSPTEGTLSTNDFEIYVGGAPGTGTAQTGWSMAVSNLENSATALNMTGKNNYITLTKSGSTLQPAAGTQIVVVFRASANNYITNPGFGAFFVKINDYDSATTQNFEPNYPTLATAQNNIDGGVTVANVMTDSIQIQTKVLETMSFSVGTVNPDTQAVTHGGCDAITTNAAIDLGDPSAENSLSPTLAYEGKSYWRLSSNSSNGATVYYSGYTLTNTSGDDIDPIYNLAGTGNNPATSAPWAKGDGSLGYSHTGQEQFGLGLDSTADTLDSAFSSAVTATPLVFQNPHLTPLVADSVTGSANGAINVNDAGAQFSFKTASKFTPAVVASENTDVIHCSTGKMRYVANIAPDTPAGIYTTKINYLASPEY
jgi:hypothetical protein